MLTTVPSVQLKIPTDAAVHQAPGPAPLPQQDSKQKSINRGLKQKQQQKPPRPGKSSDITTAGQAAESDPPDLSHPALQPLANLLEEGLSNADLAQLRTLAQQAQQHNPDLPDASLTQLPLPAAIQSDRKEAGTLKSSSSAVLPLGSSPADDALPKGKKRKATNAASSAPTAAAETLAAATAVVKGSTGNAQRKKQKPVSTAATAGAGTAPTAVQPPKAKKPKTAGAASAPAVGTAVGGAAASDAPDAVATAVKVKSSKLGRKARLRLKRQAWRQKEQQLQLAENVVLPVADTGATQEPAAASLKPKAASAVVGQVANTRAKKSKVAAAAAAATAEPHQNVKQSEVSAKAKQLATAAAGTEASSPAVHHQDEAVQRKKTKAGLLEQMRSKLSGGRFRMLNEQLYTAPGQEAFAMMQGQPALFQQYHEVSADKCSLIRPQTIFLVLVSVFQEF